MAAASHAVTTLVIVTDDNRPVVLADIVGDGIATPLISDVDKSTSAAIPHRKAMPAAAMRDIPDFRAPAGDEKSAAQRIVAIAPAAMLISLQWPHRPPKLGRRPVVVAARRRRNGRRLPSIIRPPAAEKKPISGVGPLLPTPAAA